MTQTEEERRTNLEHEKGYGDTPLTGMSDEEQERLCERIVESMQKPESEVEYTYDKKTRIALAKAYSLLRRLGREGESADQDSEGDPRVEH